jgi:HEAT repeat protein
VAELEGILADPDPKVQVQGAFDLSQKNLSDQDRILVVRALTPVLASPDSLVRQQCCVALGKIGR